MPIAPSEQLREMARRAVARGGLAFDAQAHLAYLEERFAIAGPYASALRARLEATAPPGADAEFSLLDSAQTMAAFACTVTDLSYRLAARRLDHRDDVRRAVVAYVIGSAIFDYACDEDRGLLELLGGQLSERRLRRLLADGTGGVPAGSGGPVLLRYFWLLASEFIGISSRLAAIRGDAAASVLREQFTEVLLDSYRQEVASIPSAGLQQQRGPGMWSSPLLISYLLIQLASDAAPDVDPGLEAAARTVGSLFSLVDDVADVAEDWAAGSHNRLLAGVNLGRGNDTAMMWDHLISAEVTGPHMDEIARLVAACAGAPWARDLAAWLYYWLWA
jgi:hypothetical protein